MIEKTYGCRIIWTTLLFLVISLGLFDLKFGYFFKPRTFDRYFFYIIGIPVMSIMFFSIIFSRVEIHTDKIVTKIIPFGYGSKEILWDNIVLLLYDNVAWWDVPHIIGFKDAKVHRMLKELIEGYNVPTSKDFLIEIKQFREKYKKSEASIFIEDLLFKDTKGLLREIIFRVPPDTWVEEKILKRVGLTQSDIGKFYKQPEQQ